MSQAVGQFVRDLISDVKSSRRFQVGAVLWIPLIVCGFILTIRFGIVHTLSDKYKEWRLSVVQENQITFPDLMMYFANSAGFANGLPTCTQPFNAGAPTVTAQPLNPCPFQYPVPFGSKCYTFQLSQFQSQGMEQLQYAVKCQFTFAPDAGRNNIIDVHVPGGWDTLPGGWRFEPHPVLPNLAVALHLEPEVYVPWGQSPISTWRDRVWYESTVFTADSLNPYNTTFWIRIPYNIVRVNWEYDMSGWLLLALWGGGFFFFWLLHIIVFSVAKLFLPNDSKLFPAPVSNTEYTPLK